METDKERLRVIGHAIAVERGRQGLSQGQLATMIGRSDHAYISRIENGKQAPNLDVIFDLADALDVKVSYFFIGI